MFEIIPIFIKRLLSRNNTADTTPVDHNHGVVGEIIQEPLQLSMIRQFINDHWNPSLNVDITDPKDGIKILLLTEKNNMPVDAIPLVDLIADYMGVNDFEHVAYHILYCMQSCVDEVHFSLSTYFGQLFNVETRRRICIDLNYAIERYNNTHLIPLKTLLFNRLTDTNLFFNKEEI